MVSFTSLLTLAASVSAVALPHADAYEATFAKRGTCEIIDFSKLLVSVDNIVNSLLGGLTDLSGDAALVNKLVADIETILSTVDDKCLGDDLNALVSTLTATLDKLLGSL